MTPNTSQAFNVTLIHPRGYVHAAALTEAAAYVCASLRACGYTAGRTTNTIARNAVNIVFCAHMLARDQAAQIPSDSIIFNSERLVGEADWPIKHPPYQELLRNQRDPKEFQRRSVGMIESFRAKSGAEAVRSAVEQYLQWAACRAGDRAVIPR
jgi:hypothetical protein